MEDHPLDEEEKSEVKKFHCSVNFFHKKNNLSIEEDKKIYRKRSSSISINVSKNYAPKIKPKKTVLCPSPIKLYETDIYGFPPETQNTTISTISLDSQNDFSLKNITKINYRKKKPQKPLNVLNTLDNIDSDTVRKIIDNNNEVYEIFANSDYIENSPMSSNYVFILDVTNKSIANGSIKIFLESIRYIVNNNCFINIERTFLSFITFNHNGVCFYKINKKNNSLQLLEISGDEAFIPENKKNLIFPVDDNLNTINSILDSLDNLYSVDNLKEQENKESDQLIFAIECGKALLQQKGGKLIVINSSTGWKNRMDQISKEINNSGNSIIDGLINNKKEKEDDIYTILGKSLTKHQITCDIFEMHNKNEVHNVNLLLNICNHSNGNILFYKNFNSNIHYNNLFNRLIKSISNQRAYEIIIQYYTSFLVTLSQNLSVIPVQINNSFLFPCIDVNQTYSFILHYKEFKSKENQELINNASIEGNNFNLNQKEEEIKEIYIQFSIVYTSLEGIRIIRVINKKIDICHDK